MKKTITPNERLQLIGLLTLAARHNDLLNEIQRSAEEIVGAKETERDGHILDAIMDDSKRDIDQLLDRMSISVQDSTS